VILAISRREALKFTDETNLRTAKNTEIAAIEQGELPVKTPKNAEFLAERRWFR
jgi:hypothetical protein